VAPERADAADAIREVVMPDAARHARYRVALERHRRFDERV
jgi:hypothetical protein